MAKYLCYNVNLSRRHTISLLAIGIHSRSVTVGWQMQSISAYVEKQTDAEEIFTET